jgi:hypothetical protein
MYYLKELVRKGIALRDDRGKVARFFPARPSRETRIQPGVGVVAGRQKEEEGETRGFGPASGGGWTIRR